MNGARPRLTFCPMYSPDVTVLEARREMLKIDSSIIRWLNCIERTHCSYVVDRDSRLRQLKSAYDYPRSCTFEG